MTRKKQEQLRVQLSDAEANEILSAAIDDVPGFSAPAAIPIPERRLLVGVASLAIGDSTFTRQLLRQLKGEDHMLLAARHFLWTGEDAVLETELARITAALPSIEPFVEMSELAIALESVGVPQAAQAVRTHASSARRRLLTDWAAADCNVLPAANAADTVLAFVHGMLGAAPDAPRGRLQLRVCLPDWLDFMALHNLRLADALISLRYVREPHIIRYQVEQLAGAMPVRLIFEPAFTRQIKSVTIDGTPAELELRRVNGRLLAPVQLLLDNGRRLEFELE